MSDFELDTEENVRTRAYLLWEMENKPAGEADEYWHRARERIEAESHASYPPVQSRAHRP